MSRLARSSAAGSGSACDRPRGWVRHKWLAGGINLLMIAAVLRPIAENWRAQPKDSFPLSSYPMFSLKRSKRTRVTYLVGIDARGGRRLLPSTCFGAGGLNQVRRQLNRAVREGRADAVCRSVASGPALRKGGPFADVVEVQVITGAYRLADYFAGTKAPASERVHASQPVRRGPE